MTLLEVPEPRRQAPVSSPTRYTASMHRAIVALAAVIVLTGCMGKPARRAPAPAPASAAAAPAPADPKVDLATATALMKDVTAAVERIRGLSFRTPVQVEVVDDEAAQRHILEQLDALGMREELQADIDAYRLLGLVPPDMDVMATLLDALEEQVGGFYDPKRKVFALLSDMPRGAASLLMAHELTHALEDQHFDLWGRIESSKDDDDLLFARSAVHEGSATAVMTAYTLEEMQAGRLSLADLQGFAESEAGRGEALSRLPAVLQRGLLGPYVLGVSFLGASGSATMGTFPKQAVERAYREGPVSSEQILHPERYWKDLDPPTEVDLAPAVAALGEGWTQVAFGILGELQLGVLAGATTPGVGVEMMSAGGWTNAAATGWDGDRWALVRSGGRSVVVLATVWDSETDAQEFEAAIAPRSGLRLLRSGARVGIVAGEPDLDAGPVLRRLVGLSPDESAGAVGAP